MSDAENPTTRLPCPICGGDVCEHRIEAWERRSAVLLAMWDVAWHYRPVTLRIGGTHVNYDVIEAGEHEFIGQEGEDRLIAWAHALRHGKANERPEPPPARFSDG